MSSIRIKELFAMISTNNFKRACGELSLHIVCLFSGILIHGVAPDDFSPSTIIPITKDKNVDISNLDNHCSIMLGSVFGRILDNVLNDII